MNNTACIKLDINIKQAIDIVRSIKCDYIFLANNGQFIGIDEEVQLIHIINQPVGNLCIPNGFLSFGKLLLPPASILKPIPQTEPFYLINNDLLVPESFMIDFGPESIYSDYYGLVIDNATKQTITGLPCIPVNNGAGRANHTMYRWLCESYNYLMNYLGYLNCRDDFINAENIPEIINTVYGGKSANGISTVKLIGQSGNPWPITIWKGIFPYTKADKLDIHVFYRDKYDENRTSIMCNEDPMRYFIVKFMLHKKSPNIEDMIIGRFINIYR